MSNDVGTDHSLRSGRSQEPTTGLAVMWLGTIRLVHPNRIFRGETDLRNLNFAAERGFGTLAVSTAETPLLSHIPFVVSPDTNSIGLHLVRSNPIARLLKDSVPAKLAVTGPDSYVSPDWYGIEDQVPTWNYIAVHISGTLSALPDEALRDLLDRQTSFFEAKLTPKEPWLVDKVTPDAFDRMMKAIMPCRLDITSIDGTWKMNQNKPLEVRVRAAEQIAAAGIGFETDSLADAQRGLTNDVEGRAHG